MAAGLGVLRLSPSQFWATTPNELAAAMRGLTGGLPAAQQPTRADLEALMHRYPDAA